MKKMFKSWKGILAIVLALAVVLTTVLMTPSGSLKALEADPAETQEETVAEQPADETIEVTGEQTEEQTEEVTGEVTENTEETTSEDQSVEAADETGETVEAAENTEENAEEEAEEEYVQTLTYEDDDVVVNVSAAQEGIIPENASLKVTPIVKRDLAEATTEEEQQEIQAMNDQYDEVANKLEEKAEGEEYEIAGFLSYDICFVDQDGNEVEPNGDVNVSMQYKQAAAPEDVTVDENTEVTVMHMEENAAGQIDNVVDLGSQDDVNATDANGGIEQIATNDGQEVQQVEFVSNEFSTFAITWTSNRNTYEVQVKYVTEDGTELDASQDDVTITVQQGQGNYTEKTFAEYAKSIAGYDYVGAYYNAYNGEEVTKVRFMDVNQSTRKITLYNDSEEVTSSTSATTYNVYLVYKPQGTPYTASTKVSLDVNSSQSVAATTANPVSFSNKAKTDTKSVSDMSNWTWKSNDVAVAAVSTDGKITGVKAGSTTVTATYTDTTNKIAYTYTVTVKVTTAGTITLTDNIKTTGKIDATIASDLLEKINDTEKYSYTLTWKKDGEEDQAVNYGSSGYNLSTDPTEAWVDAALDRGSLSTYVLTLVITEKSSGKSTTYTSNEITVPYYDSVQNGSFETPGWSTTYKDQWSNNAYKTAGGVWQTTGTGSGSNTGKDIEIWNTEHSYEKNFTDAGWSQRTGAAVDGIQFAEINCEAQGALYQDVLTIKGEALNFWFSHRARRTPSDTMYLVIMPTTDAESITTTALLKSYLSANYGVTIEGSDTASKATTASDTVLLNKDGVYVLKVVSAEAWHYVEKLSEYVPTSSLTRFFFVAGPTGSGDSTIGNFVDQIGFSQSLPPVAADEYKLQIKKTIVANSGTMEDLGFTVDGSTVTYSGDLTFDLKPNSGVTITVEAKDMTWVKSKDDTYVGTYTSDALEISTGDSITYCVSESSDTVSGYTKTATLYDVDVSGKATAGTDKKSAALQGTGTATFSITNIYDKAYMKNIHFTKQWDDYENAYNTRPSSVNVTLTGTADGGYSEKYPATVTADTNWNYTWNVPVYYDTVDESTGKITKNIIEYTVTEDEEQPDSAYLYEASDVEEITYNTKAADQGDDTVATTGVLTSAVAGPGAPGYSGGYSGGSSGSSSTSVDHIDIASSLTATVNGKSVTLDLNAAESLEITASDGHTLSYTQSGTSSGASGESQLRYSGTFTVGTKASPIYYTVVATWTIDDVPVTMEITTNYWDTSNDCPGLRNSKTNWQNGSVIGGSGIDLTLGQSSKGALQVSKTVSGVELEEAKTYTIDVMKSDGTLYKTVTLTIPAGSSTASTLLTNVPDGSYYAVEETVGTVIDGYEWSVNDGSNNEVTVTTGETTVLDVTNTYTKDEAKNTLIINKNWNNDLNGGTDALKPSSIGITIYYKDGTRESATLSESNSYQWTKTNTDKEILTVVEDTSTKTADGQSTVGKTYMLESTIGVLGSDNTQTVSLTNIRRKDDPQWTPGDEAADQTFTMTNTLKMENYTLQKVWDDASDTSHRPDSLDASITLVNSTGSTVKKYDYKLTGNTATWTRSVTLPAANTASGYAYQMSESFANEYYEAGTLKYDDTTKTFAITNTLTKKDVVVAKVWEDANNAYKTRSTSIVVNVTDGTTSRDVTLNADNNWTATVTGFDINANVTVTEQTELKGYTTKVTQEGQYYMITNTLNMEWELYKLSANKDSDGNDVGLKDAKFELYANDASEYDVDADTPIATFTTGTDGEAEMVMAEGVETLKDGSYTLKEVQAPTGYQISPTNWTVTVTNGMPEEITAVDGKTDNVSLTYSTSEDGAIVATVKVTDDVIYSLPESGGPGIYTTTIAGIIMMLGGALLFFQMRRRRVI